MPLFMTFHECIALFHEFAGVEPGFPPNKLETMPPHYKEFKEFARMLWDKNPDISSVMAANKAWEYVRIVWGVETPTER